jgi:hypothetical protein
MIECAEMQDRMPGVARGATSWTDAETAHLAACDQCTLEWRIVSAGARLHDRTVVSGDRVAEVVMSRLRDEPAEARPIRRISWRGGVIGVLAAAASVVLILSAPRLRVPRSGGSDDTATAVAILPELQGLSNTELESVLQSLGSPAADAAPADVPHLEDLSDAQLEQLLHAMGGE